MVKQNALMSGLNTSGIIHTQRPLLAICLGPSSHGVLYSLSPRFTILDAGQSPTATSTATADPDAATVTISGAPNPTKEFATTFPAVSGGLRVMVDLPFLSLALTSLACALGAAWTLW